ncbi:hypothetical protein RB620_27045 [Paenibacillus sp. LHD-117]|uniref:hypothetical protein n=1 Tax=Paenibacillus sp. LHD-117 TaxID=3071412 RepID=UPI0027E1AF88|nr:hypothetical protein [Paenibacillus sp. LHD-117]MDQ6423092.1 hypothetical protein [Paenibacillus sp. LHD-117]
MTQRLLIAGGYGIVGSAIAKHVRKINKDVEIVFAGRNPERGIALAKELGNAKTAHLDLENNHGLDNLGEIDLIVSALQDPADILIGLALEQGIAHIGITKLADEVAPFTFATLRIPPKRPIVPLGHSQSGVMTLVALKTAEDFKQIHSIKLAGLYDDREQMGPMTVGDSEGFIGRALIREGGKWVWIEASQRPIDVQLSDGSTLEGLPMGLLDVPSLAAATGAPNVRFDFIQGESIGTRAGNQASQDLYIEIEGILKSGKRATRRTVVSDPKGQAHLTALGVLVSIERILGLDGNPAAAGGIYLPETLVPVDAAIARFEQFGVRIFDHS